MTGACVALGIVGLVAGGGLVYEAAGEYRDARRFPLKGLMVPVGGHRVHLVCSGQGGPTVILESPQTGLSAMWEPVQEAVSRFARVCSYDRAGFGWSEPGPLPRTSKQIAGELHELLSRAGVTPPYILVGASAGGFPVLVYAGLFPDEIAGVVLVDSSHPDQDSRAHAPQDPAGYIRKWEPFLGLMHRTGILRLGLRRETRPAAFSTDRWDEVLYLCERPNSYHALLREGAAWVESAKQVRASGGLGKKPLVVLTGSRDADAKWRSIWIDGLQAELARLSTRGKQVVLDGSGHGIQFDAPGAVVDAIREISSVTGGA